MLNYKIKLNNWMPKLSNFKQVKIMWKKSMLIR